MTYEPNLIYHVYNQGNNKQAIFFEERNYIYFLQKMRKYILPYADFLAYSLMPNHFHWLIVVKEEGCLLSKTPKANSKFEAAGLNYEEIKARQYQQNMSDAIACLLSSYTKGVNKTYGRSGSLFRQKTKAKNGWIDGFVTVDDHRFCKENNYALNCFYYIHENAVKANLVTKPEEWTYSSARDYAGLRNGTLCNFLLAFQLLGVKRTG